MHHSKIVNKGPSKTDDKQDTDRLLVDHSGKAHLRLFIKESHLV